MASERKETHTKNNTKIPWNILNSVSKLPLTLPSYTKKKKNYFFSNQLVLFFEHVKVKR